MSRTMPSCLLADSERSPCPGTGVKGLATRDSHLNTRDRAGFQGAGVSAAFPWLHLSLSKAGRGIYFPGGIGLEKDGD